MTTWYDFLLEDVLHLLPREVAVAVAVDRVEELSHGHVVLFHVADQVANDILVDA